MSDLSDKLTERSTSPSVTTADSCSDTSVRTGARKWALDGLAVIGLAVPVLAYFWLINRYGSNVLWHDQFDDIATISHLYSHTLTFGTLWTQHDENRILFPNLIVLFLGLTTHLNVSVEEYLSGFMLVATMVLLTLALGSGHPLRTWRITPPWP